MLSSALLSLAWLAKTKRESTVPNLSEESSKRQKKSPLVLFAMPNLFSLNSRKFLVKLPLKQQAKLASLLELLRENPFHSQLHTKHLSGKLSGVYSFRITRDWRVIFRFFSLQEIQLIDIGHRKDIYR